MHANGGIINGGVACVCAKWRVFVHFCAFLRFLVRFCAFFLPKWPAEKRKFAHNRAKMCKKRFYAIPPLVIPPFACHRNESRLRTCSSCSGHPRPGVRDIQTCGSLMSREYPVPKQFINVQTRGIVETSGLASSICKNP